MVKPKLKLKAWQRSYSSITHFIVDRGLPDKWSVRIDGQEPRGVHTLGQVYNMQRANPGHCFEIRILERDGGVVSESPWIEVFDDTGFWGKVRALTLGLLKGD